MKHKREIQHRHKAPSEIQGKPSGKNMLCCFHPPLSLEPALVAFSFYHDDSLDTHTMSNASDRRNSQPDKFDTGSNSNHCGQLWQARAILDEKVIYLIDWEGTDPETGRNYEPSWGERPTDALLSEWKQGRGSPTGRKRKKCSQWPSPVKNPRISAGSSSAVSTEKSSSLAAARGRTIEQASSGDVEEASSKPMPDASMHDNNTSNPHETNSDEQTSLRALLQQKVAIIKAMHEQISLERSKYHGMQGALPSLRKHIDKLKGRIAALQADLATSQRQKETGDTRITSLEDEIIWQLPVTFSYPQPNVNSLRKRKLKKPSGRLKPMKT